jgi:transposase InsO family protein
VERWHQTLQDELLEQAGPFASIAAAQAAVDAWRVEYNTARPHQALDMAMLADRHSLTTLLAWSTWRRRHQARARDCHYRRREQTQ